MTLDVQLKNKILHCFKRRAPLRKKNFVANEHHSVTFMFTSSVVVDLPTDCILSFLFSPETDVLVPVLGEVNRSPAWLAFKTPFPFSFKRLPRRLVNRRRRRELRGSYVSYFKATKPFKRNSCVCNMKIKENDQSKCA